jgi:flavin reductase (DIM6/NTAB) family NADH-FMN oxidoreductase RutF
MSIASPIKGTAVITAPRPKQPQTLVNNLQELTAELSERLFDEGSELTLVTVFHEDYHLSTPIKLSLRVEDGNAVVAWEQAGITAQAPNLGEALARFRSILLSAVDAGENITVLTHVERRVSDSDLTNAMRDVSIRAFQAPQGA